MRLNIGTEETIVAAIKHGKNAVASLEQVLATVKAEEKREERQLTNKMRIAGWLGPNGFRLQTYERKKSQCNCCGKTIERGEQHASWTLHDPTENKMLESAEAAEARRRYAHPECLRRIGLARTAMEGRPVTRKFLMNTHESQTERVERRRAWFDVVANDARDAAAAMLGMKYPEHLRYHSDLIPAAVRSIPAWSRF